MPCTILSVHFCITFATVVLIVQYRTMLSLLCNTLHTVTANIVNVSSMTSDTNNGVLLAVIGSFITSLLSYLIVFVLVNTHSALWICQLLSTVCSLICIVQMLLSVITSGLWPSEMNASLQNSIMANTVGLLLCELFFFIVCLWHRRGKSGIAVNLQKIPIGLICLASLYQNSHGAVVILAVGLSEMNSVLANVGWFLRKSRNGRSRIFGYISIGYFFVVRVGLFSVAFFLYVASFYLTPLDKACGITFISLNFLLFLYTGDHFFHTHNH